MNRGYLIARITDMARLKTCISGIVIAAAFVISWSVLRTTSARESQFKIGKPNGFKPISVHTNAAIAGNNSFINKVVVFNRYNVSMDKELRQLLVLIGEIFSRDRSEVAGVSTRAENLGQISCSNGARHVFHGVEDLLCREPPKFLPNYTNPCFLSDTGKFRCLPFFQVIGMDKSGSTDLFDRIAKHPSVLKNKGTLGKETMWWSWGRYGHWLKSTRGKAIKTFDEYLNFFTDAANKIRTNTSEKFITGDGTPMDLWHMSGWADIPQNSGLQEPKYITPHLIRHVNPNVKLIAIFRDPIERTFSDYFFLGLGRMSTSGFHEAVVSSIKLLHRCTRELSLRACVYSKLIHTQIKARIHLGFYSLFLRDWFRVFPREQFLLLKTEDFSSDISGHIQKTFQFLGLRDLTKQEIDRISVANRKHVTARKKRVGDMLPKTRLLLDYLYQIPKQQLATLLGDPRFLWAES